jgi:hypothetical protein
MGQRWEAPEKGRSGLAARRRAGSMPRVEAAVERNHPRRHAG